jgi:hypothetical protein
VADDGWTAEGAGDAIAVIRALIRGERLAEDRETMIRTWKFVAVAGATAMAAGRAVAGAGGPAGASPAPQGYAPLPGSVAPFVTHTRATGSAAGSGRLTIQVWLRPRLAAAARFGAAASTPGSALYRHYLSPGGYTARFGAASREAGGVESWLRARGFTGCTPTPGATTCGPRLGERITC